MENNNKPLLDVIDELGIVASKLNCLSCVTLSDSFLNDFTESGLSGLSYFIEETSNMVSKTIETLEGLKAKQ